MYLSLTMSNVHRVSTPVTFQPILMQIRSITYGAEVSLLQEEETCAHAQSQPQDGFKLCPLE